MRPFTLRSIYEFLNLINSGGTVGSDRRLKELLRESMELGFVAESGGTYAITERGLKFMKAMESGDATTVHELLMESLESYRKVYELMSKGVTNSSELIKITGYNAVVIDVVTRLVREIEALSSNPQVKDSLYVRFEEVLLNKYKELSKRKWSRYVLITDLIKEVKKELSVPDRVLYSLLEEFVRRMGNRAVLTGSPGGSPVEINGKKVTYIMIGE